MSTSTETEFIDSDPTAVVTEPVVDPNTAPDQDEHDHGHDEHGNKLDCSDSGCGDRAGV